GDVADEVLVRCADGLGGIGQRWSRFGADLSQRFSVRAPAAFEFQRVHVEHKDAAAQITVRQVHLAGRLIEVGAFDGPDNELGARGKGRFLPTQPSTPTATAAGSATGSAFLRVASGSCRGRW